MDFRVRSFLAGAAKRDVELRDKAREDALSLAKDTLNYRAEIGMKRRQEKEAKLNNALKIGQNLIDNFQFTPKQIGVLASQGKLEQTHDWYTKAAVSDKYKEGGLPSADQIVSIADDKPLDMSFEDYMRKVVIGSPMETKRTELDTSEMNRFQRSGAQAAAQYEKQFYQNMGLDSTEFNAYALDAFTPYREKGQVFEEPFKERAKLADDRVYFRQSQAYFAKINENKLGVKADIDAYGNYRGILGKGAAVNEASMIATEAANRVADYMRDDKMSYGRAQQRVEFELSQPGALNEFYLSAQRSVGVENPQQLSTSLREGVDTTDTGTGTGNLSSEFVLSNETRNQIIMAESRSDVARAIDKAFPGPQGAQKKRVFMNILREHPLEEPKELLKLFDEYTGGGRSGGSGDMNREENPATRYKPQPEEEAEPTQKLAPRMRKRPQPSKEEQDQAMQEVGAFTEELVAQGVDVNNPDEIKAAMLARNIDIPEEMIDTFASTIARYSAMQSRNQGIA